MNVHILQPSELTLNALRIEYREYRQHLEPDLPPSQRATHFVVEIEPCQAHDARMLPGYVPIEAFGPLARKHSPDFSGTLGFCENYWIVLRLPSGQRDHRFPPLFSLDKGIPAPAGPTLKFRRFTPWGDVKVADMGDALAMAFPPAPSPPAKDALSAWPWPAFAKPLPAEILSDLGATKTVGVDMGAPGGDQTVCIRMPSDEVLRAAMERRREQYGLRIDTIRCEVINETRRLRDINERNFAMTPAMPTWRKLFGYTEREAIQKALSNISQTAAFKRLPTTLKPLP